LWLNIGDVGATGGGKRVQIMRIPHNFRLLQIRSESQGVGW
jgi:hypothetical protein